MYNRRPDFENPGQPINIDTGLGVGSIHQGRDTDGSKKPRQLSTLYLEGARFGCQLTGAEKVPGSDKFRLTFRFSGINLSGTRFMLSKLYLKVPESDSTVFARLGHNKILVGATIGDIVAWELRTGKGYTNTLGEYYIPQLVSYDPKNMGVSILSPDSLMLGYPLR